MSTLAHSSLMRSLSVPAVAAKAVPSVGALFSAWRAERRRVREDQELWALAQLDSRVMTELSCARSRAA